jgi:asparagine synthase (glutamine-hydrolysing)
VCGICGYISADGSPPPDRRKLERAVRALHHRGPDDSGVYLAPPVGLGHTRLSIIDVAGGAQPIWNEDRTVLTVFNGEIWNHVALRRQLERAGHRFATRADTEVLVHGYEEWGDDLLQQVDGMFAFALWDSSRERLLLARDRTGKKPLYVSCEADGIAFGSDMRSILMIRGRQPEVDETRIAEYLFQRYVTAPNTLVRGVEKLEPGSKLVYANGKVARERYWQVHARTPEALGAAELRDLLLDAVEKRLMSDVPLGILLSGGVDSGAVLALMHEAGAENVASFTIGFDDNVFDERPSARLLAERYGGTHHEILVGPDDFMQALPRLAWYRDEPIAEPSEIPLLLLAELAHEHVKVVLSGDGGDELFGGYPKYRAERFLNIGGRLAAASLRAAAAMRARRRTHRRLDRAGDTLRIRERELRWASWFRTFSYEELALLLPAPPPIATLTEPLWRTLAPYETVDPGRQMLLADFLTYLPDNMLLRSDKVLMGASLEGRMPLLDRHIVERVANAPSSSRSGLRSGKALLRNAVRDLLPPELLRQPKRGFPVPVASFLRSDSGRSLQRIILSERALDRGLVRPEALPAVVDAGDDLKLFTLAALELWLRANVDDVLGGPPSWEDLLEADEPTRSTVRA